MDSMWVAVVVAIVSNGAWTGVVGWAATRRRSNAEVDSVQVASIKAALDVSEKRVAALEDQVTAKDRALLDKDMRILELNARITDLQNQIHGMASTLRTMDAELESLRALVQEP